MAEIKWIKITTDMFEDEKIDFISSLPEADAIIVIWVRLLTLAGKCNAGGFVFLTEKIPYTDEMLAHKFKKPLNVVKMALETFRRLDMIDMEGQVIYLPNWEKHQNIDGMEKIRQQTKKRVSDFRERKKSQLALTDGKVCAYCGKQADTADHIIPRSKGGPDVLSNVVDCCKSCNSSKKDKDLSEFLNDSKFYTYQNVDFSRVLANPTLMSYVDFDGQTFTMKRFSNVTVTNEVVDGNATDIDIEKEIIYIPEIDDVKTLFEHWNTKGIVKHRELTQKMRSTVNARLETYTVDELKEAIDNYSAIVKSDKHFFSYKWAMMDFFNPSNVVMFLTENDPFTNYLSDKHKRAARANIYDLPKVEPTEQERDRLARAYEQQRQLNAANH